MKKTNGFEKFAKKKAGTIKEGFKKEKRAFKKEISREIEQQKAEASKRKSPTGDRFRKPEPAGKTTSNRQSGATRGERQAGTTQTARQPFTGKQSGTAKQASTAKQAGATQHIGAASAAKTGIVKTASAKSVSTKSPAPNENSALMPLNKFIAHAGICARRDAAALVKTAVVSVNGTIITEPGFKVSAKDEIKVNGKKIHLSQELVYILLNKPKDYITTSDDPHGRKTVLDLIKTATTERVYPVGRLDRNTSGVLLLTNDGDLAQQLSHPKHEVRKIYEVRLDKALTKADFEKILEGITLEDGFVRPDAVGYADPRDKSVIGIEIHSGRNRIVRRIFEHLHYDVRGLDRVMFAGLTKKNVNRGKWRLLTEKEVRLLKHFRKK